MSQADTYDESNVFARILRGEIPARKVAETDHSLAFHDAFPKAQKHILVIPKGAYLDAQDFYARGSDTEIVDFQRLVGKIAAENGFDGGFRLIANSGVNGGQEVPHYHVHIVGGGKLGPMLVSKD